MVFGVSLRSADEDEDDDLCLCMSRIWAGVSVSPAVSY